MLFYWGKIMSDKLFQITRRISAEDPDVTIFDVIGRITLAGDDAVRAQDVRGNAAKLREAIQEEVRNKKPPQIILNLEKTTYIDSCGLAELVAGKTRIINAGGQFALLKLTKKVSDLLQITKMYTVFSVFDNEETAIRAFSASRSGLRPNPWLVSEPVGRS